MALCAVLVHARLAAAQVSPAENIDLARLVDLSAERLKVAVDYDPGALKAQQVTLRRVGSLSDAELWDLTNQSLAQRGFTTVRTPSARTLSVVKATEAPGLARIEVDGNTDDPPAGFQTVVIASAQNRTAKDVAEMVRPLLTKGVGSATPLGDARLMMVSDYTPRVQDIRRVLERIDITAPPLVDEVPVMHVPASVLAAALMQVVTRRDAVSGSRTAGEVIAAPGGTSVVLIAPREGADGWRAMIRQFDQAEAMETRYYTPRVFAAKDVAKLLEDLLRGAGGAKAVGGQAPWRVIVDELTGTLMVTATPSEHAQAAALLERLDSAQGGALPMRAFPVRNRPIRELIATLERLIDAGLLDSGLPDDSREQVRTGGEQMALRDVRTPASGTANGGPLPDTSVPRVRAGGHGADGNIAGRLGSGLQLTADEATNTLIAIGEPRVLSHLESLLKMLDVRQPQVMLEAILVSMTETDTVNLGIELERLGRLGDAGFKVASLFGLSSAAGGVRTVADSAGFNGAVLNPGEFSVVVKALEALNKGRSISNPRVLVTNNEQARFSSVLQQPFARTDTLNSNITSSFGGSDSAGTTISVKPQIAAGEHLVLTYNINLSSFVGTSAAAGLPPPKQQNTVDSVATIPDGHVVVVGGLELESESRSASQLPVIGDIPGLGELFKNRSKGKNRTRFFIFIRATIMRSSTFEDLKYVSVNAAGAARINDGFPEVEPRVIR
jgi:general secretion pathway protein D